MVDRSGRSAEAWAAVIGTALGVIVLDQLTKAAVVATLEIGRSITLIDGYLNLVHVRNPGAAFSLLADAPAWFRGPFFIGITVVAVAALLYVAIRLDPAERLLRYALGGVLGGAVGNLIDRLVHGEVIDFVDVHWGAYHWPAFNVADSSISIAVATIVLHSFSPRRGAPRAEDEAAAETGKNRRRTAP